MQHGKKPKFKYKRVKIIWQDILNDNSWFDSLDDVNQMNFAWCEDIGSTVIIPTSVIVSIKKIKLN